MPQSIMERLSSPQSLMVMAVLVVVTAAALGVLARRDSEAIVPSTTVDGRPRSSQPTAKPDASPEPTPEASVQLDPPDPWVRVPAPGVKSHTHKITLRFDAFREYTSVLLGHLPIERGSGSNSVDPVSATVAGGFAGRAPLTAPIVLLLVVNSTSESWRFLKYHGLTLKVDGEMVEFGDGDHAGDVRTGYVTESVSWRVTPERLLRLCSANRIEGRFAGVDFVWGADERNALLDFLAHLKPVAADAPR